MDKYGPILKRFLLKYQAKLEFFQNGRYKISTGKIPVISGKNSELEIREMIFEETRLGVMRFRET
jgi:hypothetical protein